MMLEQKEHDNLLNDLVVLIEQTKKQVSVQINSALVLVFWKVGEKISTNISQNNRAEYGKQIVVTLSRELVKRFGRNFEEKKLRRMVQFADGYPDFENR